MKKCFFILNLILCVQAFPVSTFNKISETVTGTFSINGQNPEKSSWNCAVSSVFISFRDFDIKSCWKIPSTTFNAFPELKNPSFSTDLRLNKLTGIPLSIRFGQLSTGGSLTSLANPSFSSSTAALSTSISSPSILSATGCSLTSSGKPFSSLAEFQLPVSSRIIQKILFNFYYNEEFPVAFCGSAGFKPAKNQQLSFSSTVCYFLLKNESSSWFSATKLFPEKICYSQNFQAYYFSPFYTGRITINLYQNPFTTLNSTFLTENLIKIQDFALNITAFSASSTELYTISSSQLKTLFQLKINPVLSIYPAGNSCKIKTGLIFIAEDKVQSDGSLLFLFRSGFSSQIQFLSSIYKLNISLQDVSLQEGCSKAVFKASIFRSQSQRLFQPQETLSFSYSPENSKTTGKLSCRLKIPCSNSLFLKSAFSVTFKEKQLASSTAELSLSGSFPLKKNCVNYSVGVKYTL